MNTKAKDNAADRLTLVTLSIGNQMLAIPAGALHEVLDPLPVTRVPGAGEFSPNVLNVRGSVVPLADIGHALGLGRTEETDRRRIMVLDVLLDGDSATVVIEADAVHEVTSVAQSEILPVTSSMSTWPPEYLLGLYNGPDGFVLLPDLSKIFSSLTSRSNALPI
jgi:purine-binding chemotaxis protein CheW